MTKLTNSERKELRRELEELRETEARIRTTQDVNAFLKKEAELEKEAKEAKAKGVSRREFIKYVGVGAALGVIGYAAGYQLGLRPTEMKEVTKEVLATGPSPSTALFSPFAYPRADYPVTTVGVGLFDDWTVYDQYERAFRDVIANCGGWSEFKNRIEGQRVVIKPVAMSYTPKTPPTPAEAGPEQLSPLTVRAVAKVVLEAKPASLTIWSNGDCAAPYTYAIKTPGFSLNSFYEATKDLALKWYDGAGTSENPVLPVKLTPPYPICSTIYYWPPLPAKEADTVISIANAKTHSMARATLNLKNLQVSGSPPQVYTAKTVAKPDLFFSSAADYYEGVDAWLKSPPSPLPALEINLRINLHFKSYVDWLNKFKGAKPYDLPLRFLSFHAECADNNAAVFYGSKVKNWMAVTEFTKGIAGTGPLKRATSWEADYKALTPIKKYFLIGGYDIVAVDTVSAMAIGFSPFEIENPHSDIRYLQWSSLHGMGTHRLSEIEVKGIDDLLKINADCERPAFSDGAVLCSVTFYRPPEKRVTEFLDCRSPYLTRFEAEVGEEKAARLIASQVPSYPY